jgi:molybdopterin synthase catalytic subunit
MNAGNINNGQKMENNIIIKGAVRTEIIADAVNKLNELMDSGGHSIFLGQVRADIVNGKMVRAIEYSANESMVYTEGDKIKNEIFSQFSDVRTITIIHSTGYVSSGEISLFVMVSAGHRHHAIQACQKTVELIKERLPVWKKEIFDDGSHAWK